METIKSADDLPESFGNDAICQQMREAAELPAKYEALKAVNARLNAELLAEKENSATIARISVAAKAMTADVWKTHEAQFAEQQAKYDALRQVASELREALECLWPGGSCECGKLGSTQCPYCCLVEAREAALAKYDALEGKK